MHILFVERVAKVRQRTLCRLQCSCLLACAPVSSSRVCVCASVCLFVCSLFQANQPASQLATAHNSTTFATGLMVNTFVRLFVGWSFVRCYMGDANIQSASERAAHCGLQQQCSLLTMSDKHNAAAVVVLAHIGVVVVLLSPRAADGRPLLSRRRPPARPYIALPVVVVAVYCLTAVVVPARLRRVLWGGAQAL